jgi:hypothetical protein
MIVNKYGNYVGKFMWQLCRWGRVDICTIFHMHAHLIFFITLDINLTPTHTVAT